MVVLFLCYDAHQFVRRIVRHTITFAWQINVHHNKIDNIKMNLKCLPKAKERVNLLLKKINNRGLPCHLLPNFTTISLKIFTFLVFGVWLTFSAFLWRLLRSTYIDLQYLESEIKARFHHVKNFNKKQWSFGDLLLEASLF